MALGRDVTDAQVTSWQKLHEDMAPMQPAGYWGLLCRQEILSAAFPSWHSPTSRQPFISAMGQLASHCLCVHQEL